MPERPSPRRRGIVLMGRMACGSSAVAADASQQRAASRVTRQAPTGQDLLTSSLSNLLIEWRRLICLLQILLVPRSQNLHERDDASQ